MNRIVTAALPLLALMLLPLLAFAGDPPAAKPADGSPVEPGPKVPIGAVVPDFTLKTSDGAAISLAKYRGDAPCVLTFISAKCPISRAWHKEIAAIAKQYEAKGVKFLALMSNSTEKTSEVTTFLRGEGFDFPILDDPGNIVADELDAIGTPHMYLIDAKGKLAYSGAINDSARDAKSVKKEYFKDALVATLAGKPVADASPNAFIGCSIKRVVKS